MATKIKCYTTLAALQAEATGSVSIVEVIVGGVFLIPFEPNTMVEIDIYQDTNSVKHGLYRPI